jgi:zona occludens toxin
VLVFVLGVPGSGKSYWGVNYCYDTFLNNKSSIFGQNSHFYTNIDQFSFSSFPDGVAFNLDFDDLKAKLTELHHLKINQKVSDADLQAKAKELGLLKALFVIDEAHNYFDNKDTVLVWWLSYHRHLHQNIILLTQNLSLIDSKYKAFSENFYQAMPSSLRLFSSSFRYRKYINSRMAKDHRAGTLTLKFNPDVYSLYHSGANTQGSKVILKFIAVALVLLGLFFVVLFAIKAKWSPSEPVNKSVTSSSASTAPVTPPPSASNSSVTPPVPPKTYEDIRLLCGSNSCVFNGVTLTNADVENLKRKYDFRLLSVTPFSSDFQIYVYRAKVGVINEVLAGTF